MADPMQFKRIQTNASTGKSVIGGNSLSPTTSSRLTDLVGMLGDDGDFEMAFTQNHAKEK
jgi:hypothetical protein